MAREHFGSQEKKLIDAAHHWARGSQSYADAIEQLELLGAPEEAIEELRERQASEDFEVWDTNWSAVQMFMRVQTQWRASGGQYYGLDYNAVYPMLDIYEIEDKATILEELQIIEIGVLGALSENKDE